MLTTIMATLSSRMLATAATWLERHRTRAALSRLTAYELRDIGLTPSQAHFEAALPFWRA